MLDAGRVAPQFRRQATKQKRKKRVTMKNSAALVSEINLEAILSRSSNNTGERREEVRKLLKLTGLGDDLDIGDPNQDQEVMNTICQVFENFDLSNIDQTSSKKSAQK